MKIWIGAWYPKDWAGEVLGNNNTLDIQKFVYKKL